MKRKLFKSSKSEKRALKMLDRNVENILSVGVSTGGAAEIKMAKFCPKAKIVASTIDKNGFGFTKNAIEKFGLSDKILLKMEDISKKQPYADNSFDFVYARLVLHYLTKQQLDYALSEIHRILKPSGIFFIVARNNKEWEIQKPEFIISYDPKTNITTYFEQWEKKVVKKRQFLSEQQMQDALAEHGFSIKSCKSYKEYLYTDYERTIKSRKPNFLTEIVATK